MKKAVRIGMGMLGTGVALAVGVLSVGLTWVDCTPSADAPYAQSTRERLKELSGPANGGAVLGELRAGFGRAKLTPTLGAATGAAERGEFVEVPLAGYGNRKGQPATGVADDVWVKAVAVSVAGLTGVVVSADALIIPREVSEAAVERIERDRGLDGGKVYFGATHTHCSLGGWGEGVVGEAFAGGYDPAVRVWMAQQLATAAVAALDDLRPAALGAGFFEAPEFVRNRLVGDQGRIDPEFSLLEVRQAGGRQAVIGSFAAHATVLPGSFMRFSGDYPGYWQRTVEGATGGLAMFLSGGVGSHGPRPPESGLEGARRMGEALAHRTLAAREAMVLTNRIRFDLRRLVVDLPELQARVSDGVRLRPWAAERLLPVRRDTWLQVLRLGDVAWFSTPCDYSGELALDLKAAARKAGLRAVVTSFNGDYVGYVVPAKYYGLDSYETRTMSFFGPQLPAYFDGLLRGLVEVAAGKESREERVGIKWMTARQGMRGGGGDFTKAAGRR